ncbi:MAG: DUF4065 domain-containing protein [Clostridia bacterium]|jgi:uncharacterized phage-associated protein|nr:DUF4065 domain-containing protein [Clostridia bacterium]
MDAKLIAKWFIFRNEQDLDEENIECITNLKMQKLLYYAQGVYLAYKDNELFGNDIYAWNHGPVVKEVYDEYKSYGRQGIDVEISEGEKSEILKAIGFKEDSLEVLETVYKNYAKYSAWHLVEMTHSEKPWKETYKDEVISKQLIKEYFREEVLV